MSLKTLTILMINVWKFVLKIRIFQPYTFCSIREAYMRITLKFMPLYFLISENASKYLNYRRERNIRKKN